MAASAPDEPQIVQSVQKAVASADVPALAELYRHPPDPAARVLAAMGLERIHYNLDQSSADARLCERALFDTRPGVAYFCAVFGNGNLRLSGGHVVADAAEAAIVERFAGRVPKSRLDRLRDYVKAHASEAPLGVDMPDHDFALPLEHAPGDNRGALEVAANGAKARLVVDTGAGDIVLDAATAGRLGVRLSGRERHANGVLSRDVAFETGTLDSLSIGPVTLHHVPVSVGPARSRLVGLDILKVLGTFRIARDALTVYRSPAHRPACEQPLLIASGPWGNSIRATVALSIEGRLRTALIDSGSVFYLSADGPAMQELATTYAHRVRLHDIGPRLHAARVGQATARVVISGQPIEMTFGVFKDASLPWHYVLGSGALGDMDFFFDFPGRHSCQLLHAGLH
ncbi:retropepsin-like aspartic protease [Fulvimonas sp. R45]|uniref:retropepsin-like aspartic protease family protein n=1 Tax=Fulvimonas sp. R45 TaxID=3045937 RepID=UPI00265E3F37|nr:retropepsin-like aspartic protease [Fulvimonas sp. R45]MDO1529750.1 retropepsin-like aspartic protease [Fulvimonas sp. R45]